MIEFNIVYPRTSLLVKYQPLNCIFIIKMDCNFELDQACHTQTTVWATNRVVNLGKNLQRTEIITWHFVSILDIF